LSLLAAMSSVGIMGGLLLGGVVTEELGWRWVFLLMAPLAGAAALAAPRALPEARAERLGPRLDVGGAVLITSAGMATLFGVTRIEHAGIAAAVTVAPLTAGLLLLAAFVAWERRAPAPLLPSGVLRVRSLRTASLGVGLNAVAFIAIVYVGTLYLQGPLGYSPLEAGAALLPVDVVAFLVSLMVAGAIARRSPRRLLIGAFTVTALALLWLARAPVPAHSQPMCWRRSPRSARRSRSRTSCSPTRPWPRSTATTRVWPPASSRPRTTCSAAPSAWRSTPPC
jgi:MFS family permease